MTDTNQLGSGCCGGAAKAPQDKSEQPPQKAGSSSGCGCGDKAAASSPIEKPIVTEAGGGCCGGARITPNHLSVSHNA